MSDLELLRDAQFEAFKRDPLYFFRKVYYIPVVGKGPVLFDPFPAQEDIVQSLVEHDLNIGLKARQIGWTTIASGFALHDALFNEEHPWLFVSKNEDASMKMLSKKVMYAFSRLPKWLKDRLPKVTAQTQSLLEFSNGSRIESVPATGSTGRGDAVYGALLDEAAFMEYAELIWGAVEPLVYGKAMVFSTANGMGNMFHSLWLDSERPDSVWNNLFFPWSARPDRDEHWYERTKLAYRNREWLFYQEYPSNPEEAFAKSGRVAFQYSLIQECFEEVEPYERLGYVIGGTAYPLSDGDQSDIEITIWKPPTVVRDEDGVVVQKPNYVVGADIAEGLEHGDFTYVTVFDANSGEQVASCKSGIPVAYLDELLEWLGYYYHTALLIPERNNAGIMPIEKLASDRLYPRIYRMDRFAEMPTRVERTPKYGWYTDRRSKPKMVNDFILALSEGQVILHDPEFILEAQTYVADGRGSYGATPGNHDDVITGTLVSWQGVLDSPHYPVVWRDRTVRPTTHADLDSIGFAPKNNEFDPFSNPIGQVRVASDTKKSFLLVKANVK